MEFKSVMQEDSESCYLCGRNGQADRLEIHHVFNGYNKKHSERYGFLVKLCGERCHRNGREAVHRNIHVNNYVRRNAQKIYEDRYGTREDFIREFGRSYL